jgi:CRP-like cAMP-binding protein
MSLIDSQPRSASVIADVQSSLYCIHKPDIDKLLNNNSIAALKIIYAFAQVMCYRLRKMNEEFVKIFSDPDRTIREIMDSEERLLRCMLISGWYYEGPY